jgi:hypothetical protein
MPPSSNLPSEPTSKKMRKGLCMPGFTSWLPLHTYFSVIVPLACTFNKEQRQGKQAHGQ